MRPGPRIVSVPALVDGDLIPQAEVPSFEHYSLPIAERRSRDGREAFGTQQFFIRLLKLPGKPSPHTATMPRKQVFLCKGQAMRG